MASGQSSKIVICDTFDNGTVQDAGNGQTSYWRPSGNVTESDSKLTLHASGRPHSKTAVSTPAEKRISFFHQPVTASIENIVIKTSDGMEPQHTQLRFGFRNNNQWTFRNTRDALIVNIKGDGRLVVAWKVDQKQLDPEGGNKLLATNLDMVHGPVTTLSMTADGTGSTIKWSLLVQQAEQQSEFSGVIGEVDTQTIKSTWKAADLRAVITAEVQGRLGDDFKNKYVDMTIDNCCISHPTP
jgi:hypothetical protein